MKLFGVLLTQTISSQGSKFLIFLLTIFKLFKSRLEKFIAILEAKTEIQSQQQTLL
jgi:hypothetical protein